MIEALHLCAFAKEAVGAGYCFGASGEICSPARRLEWAERAPAQRDKLLGVCKKWDGKRAFDCSGLFRGAWKKLLRYRSGGATTIYKSWCAEKGPIATMPDTAGIAVFRGSEKTKEHIGLYVGKGEVVDARSSEKGVVIGPLSSYPWTHWGRLSDVSPAEPAHGWREALYTAHVKTQTGGGIGLWADAQKKVKRWPIPEDGIVEVLSEKDAATGFVEARYGAFEGVVDAAYLVRAQIGGDAV